VRLLGRGHGAIRATHGKTLEFSADSDIGERATCIVAVATEVTDGRRYAGWIRVTITAGDQEFTFDALANPSWQPDGTAVVRRSGVRLPGTLASEATAAASDLPRPLVAALQDPSVRVEARVEPIGGPPTAVLFALDPDAPADPRLAAELAAADLVVAEDEEAARRLGERVAAGPTRVDGRVLVVAARDLPGATVAAQLRSVEVDVLGLPGPLAAAAASPSRAPLVVAPDGDPKALLRSAPANARLVVTVPADQVPALLLLADEVRGSGAGVLVAPNDRPRRVSVGAVVPGRERVHLCFDAVTESSALDPSVRAAVAGLLAEGVPTKTAANALATLTGWDRRRAYETVLSWRRA
jgi:hypothetical protein